MSSHEKPLATVATYVSPLPLHVCISKPMTLNEYHTTSKIAVRLVKTFLITTCKDTNLSELKKK